MDYRNFGFYKCTVSKCFLAISTTLFLTLQLVLREQKYFRLFDYDVHRIINNYEIWRLITAKIVFINSHEWLLGNFIIFSFKIFEKRFGSQKYVSCIFALWIFTSVSEIAFATLTGRKTLPSGPHWLIYSNGVFFFNSVPKIHLSQFGPIRFTQKTVHYVFLANILISGGNISMGTIGVVVGLAYQNNFLHMKQWLVIPRALQTPLEYVFGRLVASSPPKIPDLMGATLEIQRQMETDALERRIIQDQFAIHRIPIANNNTQQIRAVSVEEAVTALTAMGFQREEVVNALRQTNNNVHTAATILLR